MAPPVAYVPPSVQDVEQAASIMVPGTASSGMRTGIVVVVKRVTPPDCHKRTIHLTSGSIVDCYVAFVREYTETSLPAGLLFVSKVRSAEKCSRAGMARFPRLVAGV